MDLITRRIIQRLEGRQNEEILQEYANPDTDKYHDMVEAIGREMNFSSLRYHRLDDMIQSVGINPDSLCTYCWNGKESTEQECIWKKSNFMDYHLQK